MGKVDLLSLVVWGSMISPLLFLAMLLIFEGPARIESSFAHIPMVSVLAIVYRSFVATIVGYSLWGKLLARYAAAQVAPFSLLVPVIGIASAAVFLDQVMRPFESGGLAAK